MSDIDPPVATEEELQIEDGADPFHVVEVQDDGSTPEPDQDAEEEDDS